MNNSDQEIKNNLKKEIDKARKQESNLLRDDELNAVAGGTTNFETAAGKAFLDGFMRTTTPK